MKMQQLYGVVNCMGIWSEVELSKKRFQNGLEDYGAECIFIGTKPACKKWMDEKIQDNISFNECVGKMEMQKLCGVFWSSTYGGTAICELIKQEIQKGVGDHYLFIGTRRKCNEFQKQFWQEAEKVKVIYRTDGTDGTDRTGWTGRTYGTYEKHIGRSGVRHG